MDQLAGIAVGHERPVRLPAGEVVIASGPLADGLLPPDTAAWLVPDSSG